MMRDSALKNFIAYSITIFIFEILFYKLHKYFLVNIDFFDRNYLLNNIYIVFIVSLIFQAPLRTFTETERPSLESVQAVLNSKWKLFFAALYLIVIYFLCDNLIEDQEVLAKFSVFEFRADFTQIFLIILGVLTTYILAFALSDICYPLVAIMAKYIWRKKYE